MDERVFLQELERIERNIEIVEHLSSSPILPFVSEFNLELDHPVMYGEIHTRQDLEEFIHCAEKSGFYPFDVFFPPRKTAGDYYTMSRFRRVLADGKMIFFHLSIENTIINQLNKEQELDF